jgi:hypothetical protein
VTDEQYPRPWQPRAGSANASLILGIVGLLAFPWVCSPLAIVYARKAREEIAAAGGRLGGRGTADAGVVIGWIGIPYAVLLTLWIIALV